MQMFLFTMLVLILIHICHATMIIYSFTPNNTVSFCYPMKSISYRNQLVMRIASVANRWSHQLYVPHKPFHNHAIDRYGNNVTLFHGHCARFAKKHCKRRFSISNTKRRPLTDCLLETKLDGRTRLFFYQRRHVLVLCGIGVHARGGQQMKRHFQKCDGKPF